MDTYSKAKCPECGYTLEDIMLNSNPPVYVAKCPGCGFEKRVEPVAKPQLGCSPYYVGISARICELCEAIKRALTDGSKKNDKIKLWAAEIQLLNEADRTMRRLEKERTWFEDRKGKLHEDRDD